MKARLRIEEPEKTQWTMSVTMSASLWEALLEQLNKAGVVAHPASELRSQINDLLAQSRKVFWAKDTE